MSSKYNNKIRKYTQEHVRIHFYTCGAIQTFIN